MFIFKGINSNDMGVYVREENFLGKAPLKYDEIEIDGRDGTEIVPLGYRNFSGTLNDVVITKNNFDEVLNWLNGTGELVYMGKKTRIHFLDAYQIAKHKKTFSIPFIREPFWYKLENEYKKPWGANLITNGWDSFEPYGSGLNYVDNWDFSRNNTSEWTNYRTTTKIENNTLLVMSKGEQSASTSIRNIKFLGKVKIRLKLKSTNGIELNTAVMGYKDRRRIFIEKSDEFEVIEFEDEIISTDNRLYIYTNNKSGETKIDELVTIDWIQITPVDNQHLVVEKTPIGNGLTRIQTWGGNRRVKLRAIPRLNQIGYYTFSSFLDNSDMTINGYDGKNFEYIFKNGLNQFTRENTVLTLTINIVGKEVNDNLDFIASEPIIVEGDIPPTWDADENPRIINEGTVNSQPLIKLTKGTTPTCEYEVNGVYFKYHFNTYDHVIIDCEKMEATYEGLPRNRHLTIGFEFPVLKPGDNVVKTISGDAKIEFKRKDRWL